MPGGKRKTIIKYLVIIIIIFDQLSKYVISHKFLPGQSIPVIENIFHLTYVLNRGAAFGILKNQGYLFIVIALAAIIFIFTNLLRVRVLREKLALSLILAGVIGNLIDRLRLSAVIDFLDFRIWPVFNLADSAITIGAVLLAYSLLIKRKISV
ncbi:MAG: signal peptidase II [Candidatus Omnitrophota bacterium]